MNHRDRVAFLFSGQGAQYPGMMKELCEKCNKSQEVYEVAKIALGRDIQDLTFSGSQEELNLTHNTQPCMLAADLAAYYAVIDAGVKPDVVAGFSLGEFGALVAVDALDIKKAFELVQIRADAMQESVPVGKGGMAVVMGLTSDAVEELCSSINGYVVPANYNCIGQIVVSGDMEAVDLLVKKARENKVKAMKLGVSAPFHCELVKPAAEVLKNAMENISFNSFQIPLYANTTGEKIVYTDIKEELYRQVFSPVQWQRTLENMWAEGVDIFIEVGPGKTLTNFVNRTLKEARTFNVQDSATLDELVKTLNKEV